MLFGQLECFLVVAKLGSISRAAEEMFLTQPSLTARLKGLEDEVGDQLFVRTKWGMRLTEAGREFLPFAERGVSSIENGKQRLRELREGINGHLRLGALPRVSNLHAALLPRSILVDAPVCVDRGAYGPLDGRPGDDAEGGGTGRPGTVVESPRG